MANGKWKMGISLSPQPLAMRERRRRVRQRPDDARELSPLEQLAAFAAAAGHLVFRRADRLLGAAGRLDGEEIAVAARRDEAEHTVVLREFDQEHAFAGT